jgi:branched-chain amino acid transport system permease protein
VNSPAAAVITDELRGGGIVRRVAIALAIAALIAVPYVIQQVYYVNIASQVLLYAVFALGLNVLVGYAGLVSLGHAGLFGVAAYVVAYLLAAGHGHAVAILGGLAAGLAATAGFAALALRATGISFIMITLALGEIIWGLAYRWISITGGDNGISVSTRPAPFGLSLDSPRAFYVATLIVFLLALVAAQIFVRSPFGAALCGTRDQPRRMNALGYHVWMIRFWAFMFSGLLTSVAGILFVYYTEFISPQALALTASAEGLLMVISGGAGTLLGPVIGAALVVIVKNVVSAYITRWNFMLGAIFVAIVVFMPEGLVPGVVRLTRLAWRSANRHDDAAAKTAASAAGPKP